MKTVYLMIAKTNDWAEAFSNIKDARRYITSQSKPKVPYTITCPTDEGDTLYAVIPVFKRCKNIPQSIEFPVVFMSEELAQRYIDAFRPCSPDCDNCDIDYVTAIIDDKDSWFRTSPV